MVTHFAPIDDPTSLELAHSRLLQALPAGRRRRILGRPAGSGGMASPGPRTAMDGLRAGPGPISPPARDSAGPEERPIVNPPHSSRAAAAQLIQESNLARGRR